MIIGYREGDIKFDQFRALMLRRQQHLKANLDSSTFLHFVAAEIVDLYPETTIFMTILRDPIQWAKSYLGMLYQFGKEIQQGKAPFDQSWAARYGEFQAKGLNPLRLYERIDDEHYLESVALSLLEFWIESEIRIFSSVPADQLFAFRLEDLGQALKMIAKFFQPDFNLARPAQNFNVASADDVGQSLIARSLARCNSDQVIVKSLSLYRDLSLRIAS